MESFQVDQLLRTFGKKPLPFTYKKDAYALQLLAYASDGRVPVRELKRSRFGALLKKPSVRRVLGKQGACYLDAKTSRDSLASWDGGEDLLRYQLSLGRWGWCHDGWMPSYDQTSRPGENLVVRLNFTRQHNRGYENMLHPTCHDVFTRGAHPNDETLYTMSWARIDAAFDTSEAIIEEVQSDWVKYAVDFARRLEKGAEIGDCPELRSDVNRYDVIHYVRGILAPHAECWPETTLAAAIAFVRERLGIRRIFYNTFEGGNWLKELESGHQPPRYLYTTLPKRFCFQRTRQRPRALTLEENPDVRRRLGKRSLEWFLLEL